MMVTKCSSCFRNISNNETESRFVICNICRKSSAKDNVKGGEKMGKEKTNEIKSVKKNKKEVSETVKEGLKKSRYIKCSKCEKQKFCREDVYQQRIAKFGNEQKLITGYLCRECKKI